MTTVLESFFLPLPTFLTVADASRILNGPECESLGFLDSGALVGTLHDEQWMIRKEDLLGFMRARGNHHALETDFC